MIAPMKSPQQIKFIAAKELESLSRTVELIIDALEASPKEIQLSYYLRKSTIEWCQVNELHSRVISETRQMNSWLVSEFLQES